jgi:phage shock protein A
MDAVATGFDYSYEQMLDHLTRVRQALVDITTVRRRIELQEQQLQHTVAHLQDQAQGALGTGREDLARDKIAGMQARVGALDELLQSGVLEDVGGDTDDIQKELDEAGSAAGVDKELAAMKAQLPTSPAVPELTSGSS